MVTLPEQLRKRAETQPDALALVAPGERLDYGALWGAVRELSQAIRATGLQRFGLCGDNGPGWAVADLACLLAGVVCVPVPGFFSAAQVRHLVDRAGLEGLLWPDADASGDKNRSRLTDRAWLQALPSADTPPSIPPGTAKVTFTSGSTGTPQGVCLSARHLAATTAALGKRLAGLPLRHHLCLLPLATLLENIAGLYLPLSMGATVELRPLESLGMTGSSRLDAERLLHALHQARPDSLILVPELAAVLVAAGERGLLEELDFRFLAVGGGKVSPQLLARAAAIDLPLYEGYGLSECGSVVSLNIPGDNRPGSVGRPLDHLRVAVQGDREIRIIGNTHLGYLGEPETAGADLATGDLGYLDRDGYLHVDGRRKNLLITGFGRNLSPEWLESELQQALQIPQVLVFGDGEPHPSALLVVPDLRPADAIHAAVRELNRRLPDYARLARVYVRHQPLGRADGHLTGNGRLARARILADLPGLLAHSQALQIHTPDLAAEYRAAHHDPACPAPTSP
ncbi:MAG: AMP-binding protein [Gammaproteobacteria bacterium]|nr:AMP-binding protein [Gammaproteobacteria bacterium]